MTAENRIKNRNQKIKEKKNNFEQQVKNAIEPHRDRFEELQEIKESLQDQVEEKEIEEEHDQFGSITRMEFDRPEEQEAAIEEIREIQAEVQETINEETDFQMIGMPRIGTIEKDLQRDTVYDSSGIMPSNEIKELEAENYKDYFTHVKNELELDQPDAAYIAAGMDLEPARQIGGEWDFVGMDYDKEEFKDDKTSVNFVNKDLTEEIPDLGEKELILLKTVGTVWSEDDIQESMLQTAYNNLEDDGFLVTNYDLDTDLFEEDYTFETSLETVSMRVQSMAYNFEDLTVYRKSEKSIENREKQLA